MTFVEIRTYNGVRFALDAFGLIWRERTTAPAGSAHWTRTDIPSFDRIPATR